MKDSLLRFLCPFFFWFLVPECILLLHAMLTTTVPRRFWHVPDCGAVFRGLTEQEAHFLEGLCEGVFARHDGLVVGDGLGKSCCSEERKGRGRERNQLLIGSFWLVSRCVE